MNLLFLTFFRCCLITSLWLCSTITVANTLKIAETDSTIDLVQHFEWLVADKSIQLSDIQKHPQWLPKISTGTLKPHENLWGKVTLSFDYNSKEPYLLSVGNPYLSLVDIYLLDSKDRILSSHLMGADRDFAKREFQHRLFLAAIDSSQRTIQVFLKINHDGPVTFPVFLDKQSSVLIREQILLAVIGFISGGLTILSCYFLITYIFMRSPIRFWFSLSCAGFVLLFLNTSGVLGQVTGITAYIANITTILVGALLLSSVKVAFAILERVPPYWRYVFYFLGCALVVVAFIPNNQLQLYLVFSLVSFAFILVTVLASLYYNADKKAANLLSVIGLSLTALSSVSQVVLFYFDISLSQPLLLLLDSVIMLGLVIIALAIEAHEKVLTHRHNLKQLDVINDLQHFYKLFKNSAEGLYTSSIDGELISVNPAMCSLFGYDNEQQMLEHIHNANQFYANPEDRDLLLGEIHQHGKVLGKEIKGLRKDGSEFWFSISGQIKTENDQRYLFGSIFDITKRKQSDISLEFMATHDSLTGVFNRREFEFRLKNALQKASIDGSELTLLYLDLDQFKVVNDTCGHKAGDMLISQLSQKIDKLVNGKGTLARLGGDEFGILLEDDNAQMAYLLANKILNTVSEFRFVWEKNIFTLGISIGQVSWQANITTPEQLLSMADSACYMAKERGRNQIHTYSQDDKHVQRYASELSWLSQINKALEANQFELYYQHYQALNQNKQGHHYEILLRMKDTEGNIITPSTFLPSAERYNLTSQIDRWVIENYFAWLTENPEHNGQLTQVNINLSGHSLADNELKLFVLNAFEKYKVPYNKVCFEITESMAILKMEETLEFINTFHTLGCKFALDDFGSGFSSYNYLKSLPVQQLKIDGSFVKDILIDPIDMAMVCSIKDVAKAMGMETVAEFVESTEIMVELGKMGVDYAQGYGVAKPTPLTSFSPLN
ncbi:EAL domain-containing protein [Paraglaciecola aquimarina]|uniref:EAL domain-containing protein n=1 Tax=Paraglaciecola algarum TaxID=3050085 RepID=A0ABS9D9A3_9ALTE|nr:EAL domain-containing protein [Paraglaciecola sp. G1-23]MCF2949535.1 EAL domain-containing protein [Paraglaciecola sp. G1-23]